MIKINLIKKITKFNLIIMIKINKISNNNKNRYKVQKKIMAKIFNKIIMKNKIKIKMKKINNKRLKKL